MDQARPKAPRPSDQMIPLSGRSRETSSSGRTTASCVRLRAIGGEAEERRQGEQSREGVLAAVLALAIDEEAAHPDRLGARDVVLGRVADHDGRLRLHLEELERRLEDRRAGLHLPVYSR